MAVAHLAAVQCCCARERPELEGKGARAHPDANRAHGESGGWLAAAQSVIIVHGGQWESLKRAASTTTTGTPLQQHMVVLPNVHINVAKVYTNGVVCVAVGGVAKAYSNIYTSVGN